VRLLEDIGQSVFTGLRGAVRPERVTPSLDREALFEELQRSSADLIVATGPSRALAKNAGFPIYIDSTDIPEIIDVLSETAGAQRYWKGRLASLFIHNCWNINVPVEEWKKHESLILRLASVAYFTIDYLLKRTGEVIDFISEHWEEIYPSSDLRLPRDVILETFKACYHFEPFETCMEFYGNHNSQYSYERNLRDVFASRQPKARGKLQRSFYNADRIYQRLMELRTSFEKAFKEIEGQMAQKSLMHEKLMQIQRIRDQARRHAVIRNYYDATRIINKGLEILKAA